MKASKGITRAGVATVVGSAFTIALLACSSVDGGDHAPDCKKHPNAAGCQKSGPAAAAPTATTPLLPAPDAALPVPPTPRMDGGPDAYSVGPRPPIPQPNVACRDLLACCNKVKDTIERTACVAIGYKAQAGTCANALIAYQVFGGCGHASLGLPDIFNSNGSENTSKDCTYLKRACVSDPSQCSAAYQCDGASAGGTSTTPQTDTDSCSYAADPYCCQYPNSFDCGGSPTGGGSDTCANAPDPYCCQYPNSFDCGGSPTGGGGDPCANAPDPYCCQYPNSFDCGGSPTGGGGDPCANAPDPYCCQYPNSFDCSGSPSDPPPDPPYDPCDFGGCD